MNPERQYEWTIQSHRRSVKNGSGEYVYHQEVHALFEELIHRPWGAAQWRPAADVWETEDGFVIKVDLPGVDAADIRIAVRGRVLVIEGQRTLESIKEDQTVCICERPAGAFVRTFHFDAGIQAERIEHKLGDGVLVVLVPKLKGRQEQNDG